MQTTSPRSRTMERTRLNPNKLPVTLESLNELLTGVLKEYVHPDWLQTMVLPDRTPCVSFEISQNYEKTIFVRIRVRHGPFLTGIHTTETKYYSITYIDKVGLTNQLFHTLTFDRSPYFWVKDHFEKKMEVEG